MTDTLLRGGIGRFIDRLNTWMDMPVGLNMAYSIGLTNAMIDECGALIEDMQVACEQLDMELPRTERPEGIDWDGWSAVMATYKTKGATILKNGDMMQSSLLDMKALKDYANECTQRYGLAEKTYPLLGDDVTDGLLPLVVNRLMVVVRMQSNMMVKMLDQIRQKLEEPESAQLLQDYGRKMVEDYQTSKHYKQTMSDVKKQLRTLNKKELDKHLPKILTAAWKDVSGNEIIKMLDQLSRVDDDKQGDTRKLAYNQLLDQNGELEYENFARKVYFNRGRFNDACVSQLLGYYFTEKFLQEKMAALGTKKPEPKPEPVATPGFDRHVLIDDKERVMKTLHEFIDGNIGRAVALVISAAQTAGVLDKKVTSSEVVAEFGDIGSVTGYNNRLKDFPNEKDVEYRRVFMLFKAMKDGCSKVAE